MIESVGGNGLTHGTRKTRSIICVGIGAIIGVTGVSSSLQRRMRRQTTLAFLLLLMMKEPDITLQPQLLVGPCWTTWAWCMGPMHLATGGTVTTITTPSAPRQRKNVKRMIGRSQARTKMAWVYVAKNLSDNCIISGRAVFLPPCPLRCTKGCLLKEGSTWEVHHLLSQIKSFSRWGWVGLVVAHSLQFTAAIPIQNFVWQESPAQCTSLPWRPRHMPVGFGAGTSNNTT